MRTIVISNGNLLDPVHEELLGPHDIVLEGSKIVEVSSNTVRAGNATRIDVSGLTVMPGLIDCHVHVMAQNANLRLNAEESAVRITLGAIPVLKNMLLRGFTSIRDAGGASGVLADAIEEGLIEGPRLFPSGRALSQTGGHGDFRPRRDFLEPCGCHWRAGAVARVVDGVDAVRLAAREELQMGATQIKIMASGGVASPADPLMNSQYSDGEIRAIVEEAKAANTYVMAHAYSTEAIQRAVRFGVRSIEHGNLVDENTARFMHQSGAVVVPTLITYDALAKQGAAGGLSMESLEKLELVRAAGRRSLELYSRCGVTMGFGSDLLGAMHDLQSEEFLLRSEVLGAHAAIKSATVDAAAVLQRSDTLGRIKPGAIADLLVLRGNPLRDITVLTRTAESLHLGIKDGKIFRRDRNT